MQTAALLSAVAVAVGVLRLGEGSPLPTVAAAATVSSPRPDRRDPAAALSRAPLDSRQQSASHSTSTSSSSSSTSTKSSAAEMSRTLKKGEEMSPSTALKVRPTRRSATHPVQKREASPVTGASLSINNPIRVLRYRVALHVLRQYHDKTKQNNAFLKSKGKRSLREQLERRRRRTSGSRFSPKLSQWLLS